MFLSNLYIQQNEESCRCDYLQNQNRTVCNEARFLYDFLELQIKVTGKMVPGRYCYYQKQSGF